MNLGRLLVYFESSPAIRLLRAQHAPYVIAFLFQQFKRYGAITRSQSELLAALDRFRADVQQGRPEALRDKSESYLTEWCSLERHWLHRFYDADLIEPVYQLTPHAEQVIEFLERDEDPVAGFVGTESRLRLAIDALEEVVIGASDDPATHLQHLRNERRRIDRQIETIESEGVVAPYEPSRIREQFAAAVSLLKQLQADFRAVEENFKRITFDVQHRQTDEFQTRGGILAGALDAEDALRKDDQGVSFYEFFRFIQSPQQQERLRSIVEQLASIGELVGQVEGIETLRRMMPLLLAEAEKVTQTERRLSAALRRLLDAGAQPQRKHVAELLRDIRSLAAGLADDPPRQSVALEVEATTTLATPFSRTFWSEPLQFEHVDLTQRHADDEQRRRAMRQFADLQRLDFRALRSRIQDAVGERGRLTLRTLLDEYPSDSGVIDVLGYLQIADDDGHLISPDEHEQIIVEPRDNDQRRLAVKVPLVTFHGRDSQ